MNSSFRIAFWALSIALGLPLALYIGAALLPIERSALVAWHARNPHWGLHRDDSTEIPTSADPAKIELRGADRAAPYLVAELGSPEASDDSDDNLAVETNPPESIRVATVPSETPAATPPLRRTHRAPVALTSKERPVPNREKRGAVLQAPDESFTADNPGPGESLPEPDSTARPVPHRVTSGPQLGDSGDSAESSSPATTRRNPAIERRTVEFRASAESAEEATQNESLKQEKLRLEARLANLQQHLDRLTQMQLSQSREQRQLEQLQQAAQLVQQLQQQSSVNALERQVKALQTALAEIQKAPTKPETPAPAPAPTKTIAKLPAKASEQVQAPAPLPTTPKTVAEAFPESATAVPSSVTTNKPLPRLVSKLYRPQHIGARDLQPLVTPLLTPGTGRLSVSVITDDDVPGKEPRTKREGLLVFDLPDALREVDKVVAEMDVPPRHVAIEATIFSVPLGNDPQDRINLNTIGVEKSAAGFSAGTNSGLDGCVTPPNALGTAGLQWKLHSGNTRQLEQSLEQLGGTQLAAHPRVVVVNRQQVCLTIARSLAAQGTQSSHLLESRSIRPGTRLHVRPLIASNGLIRMEIRPESPMSAPKSQSRLPQVNSAEPATHMIIPNGQTIVLAGLLEESGAEHSTSNRRQPLSSQEIFDEHLSQGGNVVRNELVVLLSAKVVQDVATLPMAAGQVVPTVMNNVAGKDASAGISQTPTKPAQQPSDAASRKSVPALMSPGVSAAKAASGKTEPDAPRNSRKEEVVRNAASPKSTGSTTVGHDGDTTSLEEELDALLAAPTRLKPDEVPALRKIPSSPSEPQQGARAVPAQTPQPATRDRVTILPAPTESGNDVRAPKPDSPPQPAKAGVIRTSSEHPYGRVRLSLDSEELPRLSELDSDEEAAR